MASFIDLMANDIWSDADIQNRVEAMVRERFPPRDETLLMRKVLRQGAGNYTLTAADKLDVVRFQAILVLTQATVNAAIADMALLRAAMAIEQAQARLARVPEPPMITVTDDDGVESIVPNPQAAQDGIERGTAQAAINAAPAPVLALVALRHPPDPVLAP